jgi:hypothetical protein
MTTTPKFQVDAVNSKITFTGSNGGVVTLSFFNDGNNYTYYLPTLTALTYFDKVANFINVFSGDTTYGVTICNCSQVDKSCLGIKYYGVSGKTYKLSIWDMSGASLGSVSVTAGSTGTNTATFSSPITLTAMTRYIISAIATNGPHEGANSILNANKALATPWMLNSFIQVVNDNLYASGDIVPSSSSSTEFYVLEPVF